MATEQVNSWIQNDCRLSKIIQSFESDFANGYLFGEILKQYQYIEDLSIFSKKNSKEAKVKNFQQVENVLRKLKVKFDAKLINQIMNEERGAALRLLYQMKLGIQRDNPQEFNMQTQTGTANAFARATMTGLNEDQINRKLEEVLQLKTTLPSTNKYQTMNKSKKLESIEKTLLKFEHTKKQQDDKAYNDQKAEEDLIRRLYQEQRQSQLTKMVENKQFMKEWEAEGAKNWKTNLQKRADTIARQQHFEDLEVKAYKDKLNKELDEATRDMMGGINEFENNLQKLGIEKNTNIEDAMKRMEEKKGIPPGQIQNFSYAATMNKIKENKNLQDFAAKERDRRRRKMIVDQARTQENLDKKKNEEQLLAKLTKKTGEEQQFAYLEWRNQQCKQLIISNREMKALQYEEKKQAQMQELERKRQEEQAQVIENHKKQIQDQKKYYRDVRRQEKMEKRKLHAEICSEVLDLIMDVADQAFEKTSKRDKRKLDKPEWRDWMEIFKQGKQVSLVYGDNANNLSMTLNDDEGTRNYESYDPLTDPSKQVQDLLDDMKSDPAYEDLLEYLSISGMFNLNTGAFDFEWGQMQDLIKIEGLNLDFQFLDSLIPPQNPSIGRTLNKILRLMSGEQIDFGLGSTQDEGHQEIVSEKENIPQYMPLKLCLLGKKYGGKRTLAKQIQEQFPSGKVKIFQMNDLIKEVYEYVSPKPQAVEDKTKKAPAKKVEEIAQVDQFAGQDTTKYKQLGEKIKAILGQGYDFQTNQSHPQDLISLICQSGREGDQLLVSLFAQRLILSYPKKSIEQINEEIRQNIQRERELAEQLKELEEQNATAGGAPDKKGKGPPTKGKAGGASNEDQLKADLDLIQKVAIEGWILSDFPRSLNQAKLMEYIFKEYTSLSDLPKSNHLQSQERWMKLFSSVSDDSTIASSGAESLRTEFVEGSADAYLMIDLPAEECFRRAANRKIDPTTGVVYHLEDNPPPENDSKLKDRLQEYNDPDADHQRLLHQHQIFNESKDNLEEFYLGFSQSYPEVDLVVNSFMKVDIDQKKKAEAFQAVWAEIQRLLQFKQEKYEQQKKEIIQAMEREEKQRLKTEQEQLEQQQDQLENQANLLEDLSIIQEGDVQRDENQNDDQQNYREQVSHKQASPDFSQKLAHSSHSQRIISRKSERPPQPLTSEQKIEAWQIFEESYFKDCMVVFRAIRRQKDLIFDGLLDIQTRYIQFLCRADKKTEKVRDFVDSFNKFSEEFPDLRQDEQTKQELLKRVDNLNNQLWAITENRRDEALEEHQRIISNGWVQHELRKLIRNAITIIQNEINKYNISYQLLVGFPPQAIIQVDQAFNSLVDQGTEPFDKTGKSPLIQKLYSQILKVIQFQDENNQALDQEKQESLKIESQNLMFRLNMISTWLTVRMKEFFNYSQQVFETMDDWVSVAVAEENQQIKGVIERLQSAILDHEMSIEYHQMNVDTLDISAKVEIVRHTPTSQSIISNDARVDQALNNADKAFQIEHLESLHQKMRTYAEGKYIDAQTFIHLIVCSLKENQCPSKWRYLNFHSFNYLTTLFKVLPIGAADQMDSPINIYGSQKNSVNPSHHNQRSGGHLNDRSLLQASGSGGHTNSQQGFPAKSFSEREFVDWKLAMTAFAFLSASWVKRAASDIEDLELALKEASNERNEIKEEAFHLTFINFDNVEDLPNIAKQDQMRKRKSTALSGERKKSNINEYDYDYGDEDDEENGGYGNHQPAVDSLRLKRFKSLIFNVNRGNIRELKISNLIQKLKWICNFVQSQNKETLFDALFQE